MKIERRAGRKLLCLAAATLAVAGCAAPRPAPQAAEETLTLAGGWHVFPSEGLEASGAEISRPGFAAAGWQETSVPSTVLAALVRGGVYPDPYFAKNLEEIPRERFAHPWWYRTEVDLENDPLPVHASLLLEGTNYSAEVWLNGRQVASREDVAGAYRLFDLDVTEVLVVGKNVLAIEVYPPEPGDFTIGFVDWNPEPPDRNMGLWREVKLRRTGAVSLADVFVTSDLDLATLAEAKLQISARLRNHTAEEVSGQVRATVEDVAVEAGFTLAPSEEREIRFTAEEHAELRVKDPRIWWPHDLGTPELYRMNLVASAGGEVSDARDVTFGIREVDDYTTAEGHRGYTVNGKEVLVRGGGWVDDMLLMDSEEKIEHQIRYVKHMNLNTIRLEGFWGSSQRLYDLADENGILVMPGWSCQWEWEEYLGGPVDDFGGVDTPEEIELVAGSLRDQVVWLRNHPSIFVWVLGSDMLPRPELEQAYRGHLGEVDPTRPLLASCSVGKSEVSGTTGVKMNGPYDYVPPVYWYVDKSHGGAYGFNTETGPGPQPPTLESLRRMIPEENLWPIDEMWSYHCGRHNFNTLDRYKEALDNRYGPSGSVEEFTQKSQVASYEAIRAMFEAFSVNRGTATGVIQWMLNSAWPEMYWQLYDHYLMPNGAFYGTRTAAEPINLVYNYGNRGVYVVNDTSAVLRGTAEVRLLSLGSEEVFSQSLPVELEPGGVTEGLTLPEWNEPVVFLDLRLVDADGSALGRDFYWLSKKEDVLDEAATLWFVTPTKEYADFTALAKLPEVVLEAQARRGGADEVMVTLKNPSDAVAFFVELKVTDPATGQSILPVFWDDNYVSLLPGEERTLGARLEGAGEDAVVVYSGWNVPAGKLAVKAPS